MKTLIVIDNLLTGGIASSLYNFVRYAAVTTDIELLVFDPDTVQYDRLPVNVTVLNSPVLMNVLGMSQAQIVAKSKPLAALRVLLVMLSRISSGETARRLLFHFVKKMGSYDLAISYAQDNGWKSLSKGCNDFVITKVDAKKKLAFIHCDYSNYGGYDPRQGRMLEEFDKIVHVSNSCLNSFASKFPELKQKCIVCENFTDIDKVKASANPAEDYPDNSVNFVSVCRLSTVKGLDRGLDAFSELKEEGFHNFTWTIVGDGPEYNALSNGIKVRNLANHVRLIGERKNPYPFLKKASVFLLTSLNEAAPMVYGECAVFGLPILTTETCSAKELVEERKLGWVVENSKDGIKTMLRSILSGQTSINRNSVDDLMLNKHALDQLGYILQTQ